LHRLPDHTMEFGSRNTTIPLLASSLPSVGALGRPVIDRTGLSGRFDFTLNFSAEATMAANSASAETGSPTETQGETFLEAVRDQLGLKFERTTAPMQVLVIDHVEQPSPN
jgi:bla regulator protein blaR1